MLDKITYSLLNKKVNGAVSGITDYKINGTDLTFTFKNGASSTMHFPTPADGASIIDIDIDEDKHLICTLSNGSIIDAGIIPTIKGDKGFSPTIVENENNNNNVYKLDITDQNGTYTTPNLKGSGGSGDLSDYYTKEEVEELIETTFVEISSSDVKEIFDNL